MGTIFGTIFSFIIVFGILVFIHEFGHFIMGKLMGVRVEVFSWGYGKKILGIKRGDTDYRISLIPMGGYVKFSGDEELDKDKSINPYDFMAKKRWQRFLIIFMGPLMNIFLAVFLFTVINMVGVTVPEYQSQKPVIGWIEPGSPAERAALKIDDEILAINNKKTRTWRDVELAVGSKPEKTISLKIRRAGKVISVDLLTEKKTRYEMGYAGFFGKVLTQVMMVSSNSPAEKAGLMPGDVIEKINGEPVYYYKFVEIIQKNPGKKLYFEVRRGDRKEILEVTPRREGNIGKIGILQVPKSVIKKYGLFTAFRESLVESKKLTFLVVNFIKDLMIGEASVRQLGGPIEIANISYAAFRMGIVALMSWIALISLQLGIINLFPIPVLDGGHIFVIMLEGIARRDFSPKVKQIAMQVGFALFVLLIGFIILNDVARRLPNGWESFLFWK